MRRWAFLMLERDLERVGENQEMEIIRKGPKADCFDRCNFLEFIWELRMRCRGYVQSGATPSYPTLQLH